MKEDPDLLHMDRTEFHLNRIMKRQGAKPPWIELQNGQSDLLCLLPYSQQR